MVAQALDRREETNGGESTSARILEYYRYSAYGSVTVLPAHDDGAAKSLVDTGGGTGVYHASDDDMGSGSRKAWDRVEDTPLDLADNNTIMLLRREADGTYSHLSARADYGRVSQFGNSFTFTARRQDPHTGLMYYRYRMYEPVSGRFVGQDPLQYVDGGNLYQGLWNGPGRWGDEFGFSASETVSVLNGEVTLKASTPRIKSGDKCTNATICVDMTLTSTSGVFDAMMDHRVRDWIYKTVTFDDWEIEEQDTVINSTICEDNFSDITDTGPVVTNIVPGKGGKGPWTWEFCKTFCPCAWEDWGDAEILFEVQFDIQLPMLTSGNRGILKGNWRKAIADGFSSLKLDAEEFSLTPDPLNLDCEGCPINTKEECKRNSKCK